MLVIEPTVAALPTIETPAATRTARWSLLTRVAFRFCALYFGISVVMTQMIYGLLIVPFNLPRLDRIEGWPRDRFLLVTRGFNWVQEFPFNR